MNDRWCAFVIGEILSALKLMAQVLLAPLELVITTTGILRLFTFVGAIVGFFSFLSYCCYRLVELCSVWLNEDVFAAYASESWLQFVGYILNFDLLYRVFLFYYFIFCLFVISFVVTYILEIMSAVVPEFIEIFRHLLKTLTGGS